MHCGTGSLSRIDIIDYRGDLTIYIQRDSYRTGDILWLCVSCLFKMNKFIKVLIIVAMNSFFACVLARLYQLLKENKSTRKWAPHTWIITMLSNRCKVAYITPISSYNQVPPSDSRKLFAGDWRPRFHSWSCSPGADTMIRFPTLSPPFFYKYESLMVALQ